MARVAVQTFGSGKYGIYSENENIGQQNWFETEEERDKCYDRNFKPYRKSFKALRKNKR